MLNRLIKLFTETKWMAWLWTLCILVACTIPGKSIPSAPVIGFDKLVHAGLFGVWIVLWLMATRRNALLYVVIGVAYGIGLEFYQQLLPFDRTFDWWDALADAVGVLLGYYFKILIIDRYLQRLY
ncbi:MAG TPA: VanZ family protein [Dyadobacter sp.]|jgi:VanZ family protein|nr:VanZ family protein [Dyadobacter sp.]